MIPSKLAEIVENSEQAISAIRLWKMAYYEFYYDNDRIYENTYEKVLYKYHFC